MKTKLSSETYDKLKWLSDLIPLIITFCGTVLAAVGVGDAIANVVLIILGALGTFLNGFLQISSKTFYKNNTISITSSYPNIGAFINNKSEEDNH